LSDAYIYIIVSTTHKKIKTRIHTCPSHYLEEGSSIGASGGEG
jgi:hypothetical protein